jgi:hypothetical protein
MGLLGLLQGHLYFFVYLLSSQYQCVCIVVVVIHCTKLKSTSQLSNA